MLTAEIICRWCVICRFLRLQFSIQTCLRTSLVTLCLAALTVTGQSADESVPGVFDDRIIFGQSAAFSGLNQELGINLNIGIQTAFDEINITGGVHGRRLELITLDDKYEPDLAANNTQQLIANDQVFALIGEVGTPTSKAALPIALRSEVPFIGPFTGAPFLREEGSHDWVINFRASYFEEAEQMIEYLTNDLGMTRIGLVYQDDSFGQVGYQGVLNAMTRRNMKLVSTGIYPRNTTAVKTALLDVRYGDPQAIVIIGAYRPTAELIMWARYIGMDTTFITLSFIGSNALAEQLGERGVGVVVTQVVPLPTAKDSELNRSYHNALEQFAADIEPGFISFEGYIVGRLTIELLERTGPQPTRAKLMETMRSSSELSIDDFPLTYGRTDNQGSNRVFVTQIAPGRTYVNVDAH